MEDLREPAVKPRTDPELPPGCERIEIAKCGRRFPCGHTSCDDYPAGTEIVEIGSIPPPTTPHTNF